MLRHDEIRVERHVERYTKAKVAEMWVSYLADGQYAMDEVGASGGSSGNLKAGPNPFQGG